MSRCSYCLGTGVVSISYETEAGYDLAACSCVAGQRFRTKWQLRAQAAKWGLTPTRVGRLEEFCDAATLQGWAATP